jgi:hypothetical protein
MTGVLLRKPIDVFGLAKRRFGAIVDDPDGY